MTRWIATVLAVGLTAVPWAYAAQTAQRPAQGARLEAVTLQIGHRVFHDFRDVQRVRLNQSFILGDTDFEARVVRYVPDFMMDLKTRKVVSRSNQPNNPAFQVVVRQKGVPKDTTWAFFLMPPHFAPKSMFGFQVTRIDFVGRPPMLADTTQAPTMPAVRDTTRRK